MFYSQSGCFQKQNDFFQYKYVLHYFFSFSESIIDAYKAYFASKIIWDKFMHSLLYWLEIKVSFKKSLSNLFMNGCLFQIALL